MKSPTPEQIKAARANAGLTQSQAALMVYKTLNAWQKWEAGDRDMDPAVWELFLHKLGQSFIA